MTISNGWIKKKTRITSRSSWMRSRLELAFGVIFTFEHMHGCICPRSSSSLASLSSHIASWSPFHQMNINTQTRWDKNVYHPELEFKSHAHSWNKKWGKCFCGELLRVGTRSLVTVRTASSKNLVITTNLNIPLSGNQRRLLNLFNAEGFIYERGML